VTGVSLVEVFVTGIRIVNQPNLSLIPWLFPSGGLDSQGLKGQRHGKWTRLCHMCKELAVFKTHNCNVVWCKMQNIM